MKDKAILTYEGKTMSCRLYMDLKVTRLLTLQIFVKKLVLLPLIPDLEIQAVA